MAKHEYDIFDENKLIAKSILRISKKLNKTPTQREYKVHKEDGELSFDQICYRFGRWSEALKYVGLKPNDFQNPPRHNIIDEKDLIDEFIRVANIENKIPALQFFRANAKYSWTPYKTKWGSWRNAVNYIVDNYSKRLNFEPVIKEINKQEVKRKKLGIDCAMIYEPINEYETVVLFGLLAKELGYKIIKIQSDFPDGVIEKDGSQINVEFEFLTSNYIQHGHPLDFNGICICWRKDCDLKNIEILSIEEFIRK